MIHEVVMPQLAMGMSEGTVVEWLAEEGARINRDDIVISIETEKVVTELPAPYDGFLHIIAEVGDTVPIEVPIAVIASTEDEYKEVLIRAEKGEYSRPADVAKVSETNEPGTNAAGATAGGAVAGQVKISGVAKKLAIKEGIGLTQLVGTGPGGRIVQRDVQAVIDARASAVNTTAEGVEGGGRVRASIPLKGMRGTIAARMLQAKVTAAQTYTFFEIDVTKLLALRATMLEREESLGTRVSIVALYAKALAEVCRQIPICNATLVGDAITLWENVDIGMAVAVPGASEYESGLVVPVIRNVETKDVLEISREIKDLVTRARSGDLAATDMGNHTVTLSSTAGMSAPGSWAVSAPILNLPAVLAFQPGSPKRSCVVEDDQIVIRDILPCGLTFDHRAMDGEPVGAFGRLMSDLLSNPEGWCSIDDQPV